MATDFYSFCGLYEYMNPHTVSSVLHASAIASTSPSRPSLCSTTRSSRTTAFARMCFTTSGPSMPPTSRPSTAATTPTISASSRRVLCTEPTSLTARLRLILQALRPQSLLCPVPHSFGVVRTFVLSLRYSVDDPLEGFASRARSTPPTLSLPIRTSTLAALTDIRSASASGGTSALRARKAIRSTNDGPGFARCLSALARLCESVGVLTLYIQLALHIALGPGCVRYPLLSAVRRGPRSPSFASPSLGLASNRCSHQRPALALI
ncbi:hypothetical protein FB451DRAFT_1452326 [Mycena latifolia]|nr:hypothetical protein FB451DRAFT_1452326 [Mycena latifolia]